MKLKIHRRESGAAIAVVGMSCVLPGCKNYEEYWKNLCNGVNSVKEMPEDRWSIDKFYSQNHSEVNKTACKWCGVVDDVYYFDNDIFHMTSREATRTDPQQRLLLQEAWHCIEDSGISFDTLKNQTAVIMGCMTSDYRQELYGENQEVDSLYCLGSYENVISNRISHFFDFTDASITVNSACASSSVTVHLAAEALRSGETNYVLAGGVNVNLNPWKYQSFSKARMLSPSGQCKTFDKDADGYVPGDGVGVLLLQRLEDAVRDGNKIYGVIRGTAVSHCGSSKTITAPRISSQMKVIEKAYENAGISPDTVEYVEAHGTGTSLGDPIEVEALTRVFRKYTDKKQYCKIGSVKTNIGHLESAAGVAGIIKVLLMMRYKKIPPTINISKLNPIIDFKDSPFKVASQLGDWEGNGNTPLRAGVSSFGFGGTNTHVLLEEYHAKTKKEQAEDNPEPCNILVFSANTEKALDSMLEEWNLVFPNKTAEMDNILKTHLNLNQNLKYRCGYLIQNKEQLFDVRFLKDNLVKIGKCKAVTVKVQEVSLEDSLEAYKELSKFYLFREIFNGFQEEVRKVLENQSYDVLKEALSSDGKILSFAMNYCYIRFLQRLGIKIGLLCGDGNQLLCELAIADVLDLSEVLNVILGKKEIQEQSFQFAHIPIYNPKTSQIEYPVSIDVKVIQSNICAIKKMKLQGDDKEVLDDYISFCKDLYFSQHTFKRYVDTWNKAIIKYSGMDIVKRLVSEKPFSGDTSENWLVYLMLADSISKVKELWGIHNVSKCYHEELRYILLLLQLGILDAKKVAGMFYDEDSLEEFGQNAVSEMTDWKLIDEFNIRNQCFNKEWIEYTKNMECANLEGNNIVDTKEYLTRKPELGLLELWQAGNDIKWNLLYKEGTYQKNSITQYPFEKKKFDIKDL